MKLHAAAAAAALEKKKNEEAFSSGYLSEMPFVEKYEEK
jgi:hypothetical protein